MVPGGGIEPPTRGFSIHCSTPELPGQGRDDVPGFAPFNLGVFQRQEHFQALCEMIVVDLPPEELCPKIDGGLKRVAYHRVKFINFCKPCIVFWSVIVASVLCAVIFRNSSFAPTVVLSRLMAVCASLSGVSVR